MPVMKMGVLGERVVYANLRLVAAHRGADATEAEDHQRPGRRLGNAAGSAGREECQVRTGLPVEIDRAGVLASEEIIETAGVDVGRPRIARVPAERTHAEARRTLTCAIMHTDQRPTIQRGIERVLGEIDVCRTVQGRNRAERPELEGRGVIGVRARQAVQYADKVAGIGLIEQVAIIEASAAHIGECGCGADVRSAACADDGKCMGRGGHEGRTG